MLSKGEKERTEAQLKRLGTAQLVELSAMLERNEFEGEVRAMIKKILDERVKEHA